MIILHFEKIHVELNHFRHTLLARIDITLKELQVYGRSFTRLIRLISEACTVEGWWLPRIIPNREIFKLIFSLTPQSGSMLRLERMTGRLTPMLRNRLSVRRIECLDKTSMDT